MTARIAGKICATAQGLAPADADTIVYRLDVPSQDVVPDCGYEGASVDFFFGDVPVAKPSVWHGGTMETRGFVAGYSFAYFHGAINTSFNLNGDKLLAYVGDAVCAEAPFSSAPYVWGAWVLSASQQPGCGVEEAQVTFKLIGAGGIIAVANQTGVWHAYDGSNSQRLDLTFSLAGGNTISMPNTGTGDGSNAWGPLAVALASVGMAGAAAGFALRRGAGPHHVRIVCVEGRGGQSGQMAPSRAPTARNQ